MIQVEGKNARGCFIPFCSSGMRLEVFFALSLNIMLNNSLDAFSAEQCFSLMLPLYMNILLPLRLKPKLLQRFYILICFKQPLWNVTIPG